MTYDPISALLRSLYCAIQTLDYCITSQQFGDPITVQITQLFISNLYYFLSQACAQIQPSDYFFLT